jgi:hypothetical protein
MNSILNLVECEPGFPIDFQLTSRSLSSKIHCTQEAEEKKAPVPAKWASLVSPITKTAPVNINFFYLTRRSRFSILKGNLIWEATQCH